jgi:signal transduction histidine kinase
MAAPPPKSLQSDGFQGEDPEVAARAIADRLASLGMLVASVAHEVNNPITYVLGNLGELARLTTAMRETIASYREQVGRNNPSVAVAEAKIDQAGGLDLLDELFADTFEGAIRIRDLVRELLNLSRPSERAALLNVHEILESTLRLASRQIVSVATLERDYQATQWVHGDRAQLGGVFLNLLTNAVQACDPPDPETQRIRICTRDTPDGVELHFHDSGHGVPTEDRETLFSPFFTTKAPGQGTGLGLYISQQIVKQHGGTIDFRSQEGGGTLFTVQLPGQGDDATPLPPGLSRGS